MSILGGRAGRRKVEFVHRHLQSLRRRRTVLAARRAADRGRDHGAVPDRHHGRDHARTARPASHRSPSGSRSRCSIWWRSRSRTRRSIRRARRRPRSSVVLRRGHRCGCSGLAPIVGGAIGGHRREVAAGRTLRTASRKIEAADRPAPMIAAVIGAGPAGLMAAEVLRRRRRRDGLRPHAVGRPQISDGRARRAQPHAQRAA